MTKITLLTNTQIKDFLLKSSSYAYFDLPPYFTFDKVLTKVDRKLGSSNLTDYYKQNSAKPSELDCVNYKIVGNKDGKYDWRPLELIHPALYVWLTNIISTEENWRIIQSRFEFFNQNNLVSCFSIPVYSSSESDKADKAELISTWWKEIEQKSIEMGLDYEYVFQGDIANCYGSIYTHSIAWALHTKDIAKLRSEQSKLGDTLDSVVRSMCYGQTNGIPQGSTLMDLIAELVLGYADELLTNKIISHDIPREFSIIRYRDDYRIFTNNPEITDKIVKLLTESLMELGLRLNTQKTSSSKNVLSNSVKEDKLYWIQYSREIDNLDQELQLIHLFSEKFPQSGTLLKLLMNYQKKIETMDEIEGNLNVMISYIVDIAYKNPKTYAISTAILSRFLSLLDDDMKIEMIKKIQAKFNKIPNTGLLEVWLQRAFVHSSVFNQFSEPLCKVAIGNNEKIWDSSWLKDSLSQLINSQDIIDRKRMQEIDPIIKSSEVQIFYYEE